MSRRKIEFYKILLFVTLFVVTMIVAIGSANASLGLDFSASAPYENGGPGTFDVNYSGTGYTVAG